MSSGNTPSTRTSSLQHQQHQQHQQQPYQSQTSHHQTHYPAGPSISTTTAATSSVPPSPPVTSFSAARPPMNASHRANSHHSSESDASVYSSTSQLHKHSNNNSNNGQFYSSSQESSIVNQFMSPPAFAQDQRLSDQEIMLDEPAQGVYQQQQHQATRYPGQGTMGDLNNGNGSGGQSLEENLDNYMAGLQVQNRQGASSSSNPLPSVPSPSYQNQTFDPTYPTNSNSSSNSSSLPSLSPSRPGMFSPTQTRMSSTSTSSQDLEGISPGNPNINSGKRMTDDEIFSSYTQGQLPGSMSTSSPQSLSFSKPLEEEKIELANKRERDLQLEEERQKRGSMGSVRSEMTAIPSTSNTADFGLGSGMGSGQNDTRTTLASSSSSSPLGQTQTQMPRLQEVEMISPPPMVNRQSSGGMAGLVAMGALDDKGREPITFDEGLLRALCDSPYALQLITERIKQSIASCKQLAAFLRSRSELEDKYARSGLELKRMSDDSYARGYCKAGTFVRAYKKSLDVHEALAQNRSRFASRLNEMSEELVNLAKEGERLRKLHKDNGARYERNVQEAEMYMEKAKSRFDTTAEELERILIAKEGENVRDSGNMVSPGSSSRDKRGLGKAMAKGGMLFKSKGPAQMQRQEDEVRQRMNSASEVFRKAVQSNQQAKQEYFNLHLPKILRLLKECADEIDMGTQYHMARYAYLYESTILADATAVAPALPQDSIGLRAIVETIDNRTDFTKYMQNYNAARGPVAARAPKKDGPYEDGFMPALPPHVQASQIAQTQQSTAINGESSQLPAIPGAYNPGPPAVSGSTFGVELSEQVVSEGTEVPKVVEKCAQAIEAYGLDQMGIYRLSGTTSKVQRLKAALDADLDAVDVMSDEWSGDINVVASVLKQWFRELPEPLLTHALYQGFIDAARYDNDRLRHIRLHEQVNELPDANYATLKFFMGHLDKIRRKESVNQMSVSNLSIVFGPTLLGAPASMGGMNLEHMSFQCKAVETILERYKEIFVEEEEAPAA